uniref:Methyltransferase n=1 Tax=viral metagenome TaxID=1070528 RepID=A0A6C0LZF0_9ZZZZ
MNFEEINNGIIKIYGHCPHRERTIGMYNCIQDIIDKNIKGDFVEAGVAQGVSSAFAILMLKTRNSTERDCWLYDTFEGIENQKGGWDRPLEWEKDLYGKSAANMWDNGSLSRPYYSRTVDFVKNKIVQTGYPENKLHFIKGKVEDTIPDAIPSKISILRLDTDFYLSTKHELEHLYPLLEKGGYLLIDDYGHFTGAKKAVHEYFGDDILTKENFYMAGYTCLIHKKI